MDLIKKNRRYLYFLLSLFLLFLVALLIYIPYTVIKFSKPKLVTSLNVVEERKVGIVFGASVKPDKTPSDMLKDRLDTAWELYQAGKIEYVIVSGDNNTKKYNEPQVMYKYLLGKGIPTENIIRDYAGLRTYDTCIRAKTLWNVNKASLITQEYHLYRAIYTCEKLGIESTGVSATRHKYVVEDTYRIREYFAIVKSFFDLNILKPSYIGGKVEGDFSE